MPELPEVETIRRRLARVLPGKKILQVEALHPKSFLGSEAQLTGSTITDVDRRAKILRFKLDSDYSLLTHLKMTGQLIYVDKDQRLGGGHPTADWVQALPSRHTRITYQLSDQASLFFNDQRIFGWMKLLPTEEADQLFTDMAPDINHQAVTVDYLQQALKRRTQSIKQAIMNNDIVCGVGNIYACDALNIAKISPHRPANSLDKIELTTLLEAMQQVIKEGIDLGGTTFDGKYVDISGFAGGYQHKLRVYGREGEQCHQCGGTIVKEKLGGRGTYFCSMCQAT